MLLLICTLLSAMFTVACALGAATSKEFEEPFSVAFIGGVALTAVFGTLTMAGWLS